MWDHRFPVPDPSPHLTLYHDEVTHCQHDGPYSGQVILCQGGCGCAICGHRHFPAARAHDLVPYFLAVLWPLQPGVEHDRARRA